MGIRVDNTVAISSRDRSQDPVNQLKTYDFIKDGNEGGRADVTTVATNSSLAAIKLFYNILNRLIAESVGVNYNSCYNREIQITFV